MADLYNFRSLVATCDFEGQCHLAHVNPWCWADHQAGGPSSFGVKRLHRFPKVFFFYSIEEQKAIYSNKTPIATKHIVSTPPPPPPPLFFPFFFHFRSILEVIDQFSNNSTAGYTNFSPQEDIQQASQFLQNQEIMALE